MGPSASVQADDGCSALVCGPFGLALVSVLFDVVVIVLGCVLVLVDDMIIVPLVVLVMFDSYCYGSCLRYCYGSCSCC